MADSIENTQNERQKESIFCEFKNNKCIGLYLKYRLWANIGILAVLFLANCFASWVTYAVFSVLAVIMLCDTLENGISYIMFALPFCLIYPYISLIIFLCAIALYAIKFYVIYFFVEKGKFDWKIFIFAALFLIYAIMPIGQYSINTLFKIAIILIVYIALFAIAKKWKVFQMGLNIKILACSLLLSFVYGAFLFVSPYLQTIISLPQSGSLFRYQALLTNTNLLAMLCEIVLSILAYQIIKNKRGIFEGVLFGCIAFAGIFTFSKLYFVTLIFVLLAFYIAMLTINWKKTLLFGLMVAILMSALIVSVHFVKPEFFSKIIGRFGDFKGNLDEVMNELTTSRWHIWKTTFAYWGTNPLSFIFGRGLGANVIDGLSYSAHNTYISMIDQLGIVGSILFIIPLVLLFREIAKSNETKISKAIIIPIIVLATIFMVEDLLFYINQF